MASKNLENVSGDEGVSERVSTCRENPKGVHIGGIQFVPALGYWCAACQRTFDLVPEGEGELLLELGNMMLEYEPGVDKVAKVGNVCNKLAVLRSERASADLAAHRFPARGSREICMLTWGTACSRSPVPKPHTCRRWALGHEHRCAYCYTPKPEEVIA